MLESCARQSTLGLMNSDSRLAAMEVERDDAVRQTSDLRDEIRSVMQQATAELS